MKKLIWILCIVIMAQSKETEVSIYYPTLYSKYFGIGILGLSANQNIYINNNKYYGFKIDYSYFKDYIDHYINLRNLSLITYLGNNTDFSKTILLNTKIGIGPMFQYNRAETWDTNSYFRQININYASFLFSAGIVIKVNNFIGLHITEELNWNIELSDNSNIINMATVLIFKPTLGIIFTY